MLVQKYRPKTIDKIIGQGHIQSTLMSWWTGKLPPAVIFHGSYGTGKTTSARILAAMANCEERGNGPAESIPCRECESCKIYEDDRHPDIHEINAAQFSGVADARDLIARSDFMPRYKKTVYILDEVHQLSKQAWQVFLKPFEDAKESILWVMCTTNPEKIPSTIQSRCSSLNVRLLPFDSVVEHIMNVASAEELSWMKPEYAEILAQNSGGHLRDALQLLDAVSSRAKDIDPSRLEDEIHTRVSEVVEASPRNGAKMLLFALLTGSTPTLFQSLDILASFDHRAWLPYLVDIFRHFGRAVVLRLTKEKVFADLHIDRIKAYRAVVDQQHNDFLKKKIHTAFDTKSIARCLSLLTELNRELDLNQSHAIPYIESTILRCMNFISYTPIEHSGQWFNPMGDDA